MQRRAFQTDQQLDQVQAQIQIEVALAVVVDLVDLDLHAADHLPGDLAQADVLGKERMER